MAKKKKLCEICGENPATVPDRERMGRLINRVCSSCHALRLAGDMKLIFELHERQPEPPQRALVERSVRPHVVPITLKQAREFVAAHHRHNKPPVGWKFGIGLQLGEKLIGVATAGRPVARHYDDGLTLEVNRTCTDGTPNANSMLYGAVWRAAKAMGYKRCITYTQADETGASLRAAGWVKVKTLEARKSWAESSVALKDKRDPVGNGGVPRVLWECRIHGA